MVVPILTGLASMVLFNSESVASGRQQMIRSQEAAAQAARIAELKKLIKTGSFESLEKLEEAVDAFLWRDEDDEVQHSSQLALVSAAPDSLGDYDVRDAK
jgi:hypothetical protein